MWELKTLDIYAKDRVVEPTISITYTLKNQDKEKHLDMFKIWVHKDFENNYEILNYANLLHFEIITSNNDPKQKHIYRAYQKLFSKKLWQNYREETIYVFGEATAKLSVHLNFVEYTKGSLKKFVENEIKGSMKKSVRFRGDDGLENEKI